MARNPANHLADGPHAVKLDHMDVPDLAKVAFVFSNDPDPMLVERMRALEESGEFEPHAIYWHRTDSVLSYPFSPEPLPASRFVEVDLPDPRGNIAWRTVLTFRFAARLRAWFDELSPAIVHAIYPNMLVAARLALIGRKMPIVYDIWDVADVEHLSPICRSVWRILLARTPHVFTTSERFIDGFLEPNKLLAARTALNVSNAPYFVDRLGPPRNADSLTIGCIGNIRVPKQIENLVAAVKQVREEDCDVRIRFSGAGQDSQLAVALAEQHDFVEYTGPYDYRKDSASLYEQLDLVYAVYPLEIFNYQVHVARRLHDAILSGTPIVVSRQAHMGSLVAEQGVGWSVDDNSVKDLVELLRKLSRHRSLLGDARRNAIEKRHEHSFEAYRNQYVDAYRALCRGAQKATN